MADTDVTEQRVREIVESTMSDAFDRDRALQTLELQNYIKELETEKKEDRRAAARTVLTVGGVTLLSILGLTYSQVIAAASDVATSQAKSSIEQPLEDLQAAKRELELASRNFEQLENEIKIIAEDVAASRSEVARIAREADQVLGALRIAEGGVQIVSELKVLYQSISDMRQELVQAKAAIQNSNQEDPRLDELTGER